MKTIWSSSPAFNSFVVGDKVIIKNLRSWGVCEVVGSWAHHCSVRHPNREGITLYICPPSHLKKIIN